MRGRASRDPRSVVERLVPEVFEGSRHSPIVSTFLRGVTTGALVGAAIAGSALIQRRRAQLKQEAAGLPHDPLLAGCGPDRPRA